MNPLNRASAVAAFLIGFLFFLPLVAAAGNYNLSENLFGVYNLTNNNVTINTTFASAVFDGSTSFLTAAVNGMNVTQQNYSFSAWIYPTSTSGDRVIISQASGGFMFGINGNQFLNWVDTDGSSNYVSIGTINTNTWTHLAWISNLSNGSTCIWVNGVFSACTNASVLAPGNQQITKIGQYAGGNRFFSGVITDMRVFNRSLTPAEIKSIYNNETTALNGAILWYPFNVNQQNYTECKTANAALLKRLFCDTATNCRYDGTNCYDDRQNTGTAYTCINALNRAPLQDIASTYNLTGNATFVQGSNYYSCVNSTLGLRYLNNSAINVSNVKAVTFQLQNWSGQPNDGLLTNTGGGGWAWGIMRQGTNDNQFYWWNGTASIRGRNLIVHANNQTWETYTFVMWPNQTVQEYINGVYTMSTGIDFSVATVPSGIGVCWGSGAGTTANMNIRNLILWNVTLNTTEVTNSYNGLTVQSAGVMANYPMQNSSTCTPPATAISSTLKYVCTNLPNRIPTQDISGNGNTLTPINNPSFNTTTGGYTFDGVTGSITLATGTSVQIIQPGTSINTTVSFRYNGIGATTGCCSMGVIGNKTGGDWAMIRYANDGRTFYGWYLEHAGGGIVISYSNIGYANNYVTVSFQTSQFNSTHILLNQSIYVNGTSVSNATAFMPNMTANVSRIAGAFVQLNGTLFSMTLWNNTWFTPQNALDDYNGLNVLPQNKYWSYPFLNQSTCTVSP